MWEKLLVTLAIALIDYFAKAQKVKLGEEAIYEAAGQKLVITAQGWLLRARESPDRGAGLRVVDPDARLVLQAGVCPADPHHIAAFCPLRRGSPADPPV